MISAILEGLDGRPERGNGITFVQTGGAIAQVAAGATAFPQRDALAIALCNVRWRHGDHSAEHVRWIRDYWARLESFTHGFYVNDVELDQTAAEIQATYRHNRERLVVVKNRHDLANLFRLNANIQPTA